MKNVEKVFSLLEDALGKYDNKTHRGCLKTCVEVEGRVMDLLIYECYDGGLAVLEDNSLVKYIREEKFLKFILVVLFAYLFSHKQISKPISCVFKFKIFVPYNL